MLRALTALRFWAALVVFLSHAPLTRPAALVLSAGYSGVGFFFLLSGFILTYNYSHAFTLRRFYAARFARVYPVHLFGMIFAIAVLLVAGGGPEWNDAGVSERTFAIAVQTVLMQSWFPSAHIHFSANGPDWSLSCEAFFYALFPLALVAMTRIFRGCSAATVLLAAAAVWALLTASLANVNAPFDDWILYVFPPMRFIDFCVGMLLGLAFLRLNADSKRDGTLYEVFALCGLAAGVAVTAYAPQSLRFSAAMMPFGAAAIVIFALGRGGIARALSSKWLVRLGEASYAFYLVHRPIIELVQYARVGGIAGFVLALVLSTAASLAVFAYLETPARRAIRVAFERRPAAAPALQTL